MITELRLKVNRRRAKAIQYDGTNASEIQKFLELEVREEKNHEYLLVMGQKIYKGEWVVRNELDEAYGFNLYFEVMTSSEIKEKYNKRKGRKAKNGI